MHLLDVWEYVNRPVHFNLEHFVAKRLLIGSNRRYKSNILWWHRTCRQICIFIYIHLEFKYFAVKLFPLLIAAERLFADCSFWDVVRLVVSVLLYGKVRTHFSNNELLFSCHKTVSITLWRRDTKSEKLWKFLLITIMLWHRLFQFISRSLSNWFQAPYHIWFFFAFDFSDNKLNKWVFSIWAFDQSKWIQIILIFR